MEVFNHYARYYDLLYANKSYEKEADYVDNIIKKHLTKANTVLDLGCGTGTHDFFLNKKGYDITGVDLSQNMIDIAEQKRVSKGLTSIRFQQGDILKIDLKKEFDVVVSLFHVMNYLTINDDLEIGFTNACKHLKKGGLFIFDSWYGPAVLFDLPKKGSKTMEDEHIKVVREVNPEIHFNRNVVDVNYHIQVQDKQSSEIRIIDEKHSVRYFFKPEIDQILLKTGMELLLFEEWLSSKVPGNNTFGVCFVARKK